MEANPQSPPSSPEFTPRQLELIAALSRVGNQYHLEAMLRGALVAIKQDEQVNPELFVHAAQSLRELMDGFEEMRVSEQTDQPNGDEAGNNETKRREYAEKWTRLITSSTCFEQASASWTGMIDSPLRVFLADTEAFIRRYYACDKYLKTKRAKIMITFDPMFENLSEDEQQRIGREWRGLKEFFNGVAHHSRTTRQKMENELERLEIFLHRKLTPGEVANKNAILAFIAEIEGT